MTGGLTGWGYAMGEMLFTNFSSGELSDTLFGRVDLPQYYQGASLLKNFGIIPTGGVTRRSGSKRLGNLSAASRLIPFIVDRNRAYILEFGTGYIKVWKNGEKVMSGENQLSFVNAGTGVALYSSLAHIRDIQYAQHYNTMIFVHRDYPPLELIWNGGDSFSLGVMNFDFSIQFEINDPDGIYTIPEEGKYDTPLFNGSGKYPGCAAFYLGRLWLAGSRNEPQKVWVSNAPDKEGNHYNWFSTYKKYVTVSKIIKDADLHIFTGTITSGSEVITGVSQDLTAALSNSPEDYYLSGDYFPVGTKVTAITANSVTVDHTPSESKTGQTMTIQLWKSVSAPTAEDYVYETTVNAITVDSSAFIFEIASDMNDAIRWMAQSTYLVLGTETAEWVVPNTVTANAIRAVLSSRHGSDALQGTCIGKAVVFFASGRKAVREYYYQTDEEGFRANDIAMLAPQMLRDAAAVDFDFVSTPYSRIIITRDDGTLAVMLYEKDSGVMGWSRYEIAGGVVLSCATVPGNNGYDDVYIAVQRGALVMLELLEEEAPVYLDGYAPYTGAAVLSLYGEGAIIHDQTAGRAYPCSAPPGDVDIAGHTVYIGYPFESRMRSMPILTDKPNDQKRISAVILRFKDSFLPTVEAFPASSVEWITGRKEPFSGVVRVPFPGTHDRDVMISIATDKPQPCTVLSMNAETA
jgi:hypothetical protein